MKRIQIASLGKRIVAALIDIALMAGLTCLFYFCVFQKVVANVQHFDTMQANINQEYVNSGLYEKKDNGQLILYTLKHPSASSNELKEVVHKFYTDYLFKNTTHDEKTYNEYWFDVYILHLPDSLGKYKDAPVFDESDRLYKWENDHVCDKYLLKDGISEETLKSFFVAAFGTSTRALALSPKVYSQATQIAEGTIRAVIYASLIGSVIPFLIIPVCLKNGKSLGKLIMGLVVLTDDGYEYRRWKHLIRYASFYLIEAFGGVVTIGLTLIFSSCLALFTRKKRALHDFIAFSVVVDEKKSVFFKDEDEELMYKEKQESILQKKNA